ncbi:MAG TPA: hemerythrin domain-containing protein, partial [Polyangiaceae bacterium]
MKATDLLKKQHREVRDLFKRIEKVSRNDVKRDLFEELAANLVGHDAIEREIFYPACEEELGMTDLLGEALAEHGVVEFCLYLADQAPEEDFEYKCTVLKEVLEHHIEEEE